MKQSYENIRKIHRQEKENVELIRLDEDFFDSLPEFVLEEKSKLQDMRNSLDDSVVRKLNNIKSMLEDIIYSREKKIINKAILKTKNNEDDTKNMTLDEQKIYYKLVNVLYSYQKFAKGPFEGEIKEDKPRLTKIKILQDVPKFIGTDMQEYGPFEKETEIEIIEPIAKIFIKKGIGKDLQ